jgi:hypothetical protein
MNGKSLFRILLFLLFLWIAAFAERVALLELAPYHQSVKNKQKFYLESTSRPDRGQGDQMSFLKKSPKI